MNVYEEAHNLSKAIKESNEYKDFNRLNQEIESDDQLRDMIQDYHKLSLEMQTAQLTGQEMGSDLMSRLQGVYGMLMTKPKAAEFLQAEMRFSIMMKDVYEILGDAINIKL